MIRTGPRVDLPPLDQFGPWPTEAPRLTSHQIVRNMREMRERPRAMTAARLVPEDVRTQSTERWRVEHEALLAHEDEQRQHLEARSLAWAAWCTRPWWSRLIDCVFREEPPPRPAGPGHVAFATVTMTRYEPQRPHNVDCGDHYSSFDCPMPRHIEEP